MTALACDGDLEGFFDLHSGNEAVAFPGPGETILSIGAAETMGIDVGDTVTLRDADMQTLTLKVAGVFDNNVYNYAIFSQQTVEDQWGAPMGENLAYITLARGADPHSAGAVAANQADVGNVAVSEDIRSRIGQMMGALDYVVLLVVAFAAGLAFVVLYNLTNINISERLREIATIKVLGFTKSETNSYVFRESLALTVMGAVLGLVLGKFLHAFVMSQIRIDMIYFEARVSWLSYLLSLLMTILFAFIVDILMSHKLDRINMAEALKAVE